jgi:hypothetical protein
VLTRLPLRVVATMPTGRVLESVPEGERLATTAPK